MKALENDNEVNLVMEQAGLHGPCYIEGHGSLGSSLNTVKSFDNVIDAKKWVVEQNLTIINRLWD